MFQKFSAARASPPHPLACICYSAEIILMKGPYDIQISMSPLALKVPVVKNEVFLREANATWHSRWHANHENG